MAKSVFINVFLAVSVVAGTLACATSLQARPQHAIAMNGEPALNPGFDHLPYANPDAPQGGTIRLGESGSFDSLNPWILTGRAAAGIDTYVTETLMARSRDEPFTLYGLLAETVETDPQRSWVEFTLRPQARFSDGAPVTVDDVIWSYETLGTQGHPRYRNAWAKVASITQTGPRRVRLTFNSPDRELALIMGMRPILEKAQWEGKDFATTTHMVPIGSGPYVVGSVDQGKSIRFERDQDWWGQDINFNAGLWNFDTIQLEYFSDANVIFEAFKAGAIDIWREMSGARWDNNYNFAAVSSGDVVKDEIPHERPSGMDGLVFNTRRAIFSDWRVREALTQVFNYEFINQTLNDGSEPRAQSYFDNSVLGMREGPATGRVRALLTPFAASLPPGTMDGNPLPVTDGRALNRRGARAALSLLNEAGWHVADDGILRNDAGQPFRFEILLRQGGGYSFGPYNPQPVVSIFLQALARIGVFPEVTVIDDAQYVQRTRSYNFDMTWYLIALSLSPGNEQPLYWGAQGVETQGTRNMMGANNPAIDAMIEAMLTATDQDDYIAAVRALDRVLTSERYVIPAWYSRVSRLAHKSSLAFPDTLPVYGDWPGFLPDVWWSKPVQ